MFILSPPFLGFKRAKPEYLKTSSEIIIHLSALKTQFRWTYGVLVMVKTVLWVFEGMGKNIDEKGKEI